MVLYNVWLILAEALECTPVGVSIAIKSADPLKIFSTNRGIYPIIDRLLFISVVRRISILVLLLNANV